MFGKPGRALGTTEFFRPALILLSGNALGPALAMLLTPALSRLYAPKAFGIFAVVSATAGVFAAMASWRYDMAISLPKKTREAASLVWLAVMLSLATAACSVLLTWLAGPPLARLLKHGESVSLFWYVPLLVLSISLNGVFCYWAIRRQNFRRAAMATGFSPVAAVMSQIALAGLTGLQEGGLVLGSVMGLMLTTGLLTTSMLVRDRVELAAGLRWSMIRKVAKSHSGMARYALQTNFLNRLSHTFLPFVLVGGFGATYGGLYMLTEIVIARPFRLVVGSIWQVNHALLPRLERTERIPRVMQVNRWSCYIFAFPLVAAATFASFFPLIFGSNWQDASRFVPWIALMVFFNSVSSNTSYFIVFGRLRTQTFFESCLAVFRLAVFVIGLEYFDVFQTVVLYSIVSSCVYLGTLVFWGNDLGCTKGILVNISLSGGLSLALLLAGRWALDQHLIAGIVFLATTPIIYLLFAYPKLKFSRVVTGRT